MVVEQWFLEKYFTERMPRSNPGRRSFQRARLGFRRRNVQSLHDLERQFDSFSDAEQFVAILVFADFKFRKALPLLFREISRKGGCVGAASSALSMLGGREIFHRLLRLYKSAIPDCQGPILSAIALMDESGELLPQVEFLRQAALDRTKRDFHRGIAVDGLANLMPRLDRRTRLYRNCVQTLLSLLSDDSSDIRCEAASALGELREKRALKSLEKLVDVDFGYCRDMGTVSSVAENAVKSILGIE